MPEECTYYMVAVQGSGYTVYVAPADRSDELRAALCGDDYADEIDCRRAILFGWEIPKESYHEKRIGGFFGASVRADDESGGMLNWGTEDDPDLAYERSKMVHPRDTDGGATEAESAQHGLCICERATCKWLDDLARERAAQAADAQADAECHEAAEG